MAEDNVTPIRTNLELLAAPENCLVEVDQPYQTIENCMHVVDFVRHSERETISEEIRHGHYLVLSLVRDALEHAQVAVWRTMAEKAIEARDRTS